MLRACSWLCIAGAVIQGCGESQEDKASRAELSATVRQINAAVMDLHDNQRTESEMTLLKLRDFYAGYTDQLRTVRSQLAGRAVTDRFRPASDMLDSVLAYGVRYLNVRQSLMLGIFGVSNAVSEYRRCQNQAYDYVRRSSSNEYLRTAAFESLDKAISAHAAIAGQCEPMIQALQEYRFGMAALSSVADSLNRCALRLGFVDTLTIGAAVMDTTQLPYSIAVGMAGLDLDEEHAAFKKAFYAAL